MDKYHQSGGKHGQSNAIDSDSLRSSDRRTQNNLLCQNIVLRSPLEHSSQVKRGQSDIQKQFNRFKQKLEIGASTNENISVLQPKTTKNRSKHEMGRIYSKQKHLTSSSNLEQYQQLLSDKDKQILLKNKQIAKLQSSLKQLTHQVKELQESNGKLSGNMDVLQKAIQFSYDELQNKNNNLQRFAEGLSACGVTVNVREASQSRQALDAFVDSYKQKDKFVGLCMDMVQTVIPEEKLPQSKINIKKCWKLLKGIVEDYAKLTDQHAQDGNNSIEELRKELECRNNCQMVRLVRAMIYRLKTLCAMREDCPIMELKHVMFDQSEIAKPLKSKKIVRLC